MTIKFPDFKKMYDYETNFHLTMNSDRFAKLICHYEIFEKVINVSGDVVECGVFKGTSLARFGLMRKIFGSKKNSKIIAFDVFSDVFPTTEYKEGKIDRKIWIKNAGPSSISKKQMSKVFKKQGTKSFDLIAGDITKTLPKYIEKNPKFKSFELDPGDIVFFNHYIPHRSKPNKSKLNRAQLYITYNLKKDGSFRKKYFKEKRISFPPNNERPQGSNFEYRI